MSNDHGPDRRTVLRGAGATAAGLALAACGSGSGGGAASGSTPTGTTGSTAASSPGPSSGPAALATTTEIPVGGGKVFAGQNVVITQPSAGTFKGFSATCTHQGCQVGG